MRSIVASLTLGLAFALAGCEQPAAPAAQYPQGYPPGQLPPGQLPPSPGLYPPGQFGPQGGYAPPQGGYAPGYPQGGYAQPGQPAPVPQAIPPGPPVLSDPVNDVNMAWLRAAAAGVLNELVAALPPASRARVQGIPFVPDQAVGDVNAYAACNRDNQPLMSITDGLLQIEAYVAQLRATDEVFGTQKLDAYLQYLVQNQKPRQPIVAPPPGLVEPAQHTDYRKVVREHQLLEEQMAFVMGHELAHHHLGHTGCAIGQSGNRQVTTVDLIRLGQQIVPFANQINETSADDAGVWTLLTAGARRQGHHWTEQGAILTLEFFARLDGQRGDVFDVLLSSHPNPRARIAPVQQAAARWRASGGTAPWQALSLP
jgi:hypothetical protein